MRAFRWAVGLAGLAVLCTVSPVAAQSGPGGPSLVQVTAAPTVKRVSPGQTFHLAFTFTIQPQWHIYWQNAGESGLPTSIEVTAPDGYEVGAILWPRPISIPGPLVTYGYEHEVVLFVPVTAPNTLESGQASFSAVLDWLVCKESCLPGYAEKEITVETIGGVRPPRDDASDSDNPGADIPGAGAEITDARQARYFQRVPVPIKRLTGAKATFDGERLVVTGPLAGRKDLRFFPIDAPGVTFGASETFVQGDAFRMSIEVEIKPHNARGKPIKVAGVVALGTRLDDPAYHLEIPIDEPVEDPIDD